MKSRLIATALAAAVLAALAACQREAAPEAAPAADAAAPAATAPAAEPAKAAYTDLEQLAQRVVTQSAAVKEGEVVLITGRTSDAELLENIAVNVRKVGGFPLIEYGSDRLDKRMFFDVPDKYDTQASVLGSKLADMVNVVISVGNDATENLFEGADPKRLAARGKTGEPVMQKFLRKVRNIEIGNNLYPTPWRAERYGLAQDELARTFWNGVNLDYSELQTRGAQVKGAIAAGGEVHITNPNGTDLKLSVKGRPVLVSDGVVSAEDMKAGAAAAAAYLPAGEVYTTPVAGSAEGKVVATRLYFRGKEVSNLTLTVSGGKVTAMSGEGPGYADLKAGYDAVQDPRKDQFGFIDIGINPNVQLPATSKVGNWVPAGSVTVGTGVNIWAGGDNSVPYGLVMFLPGSTVTLDGKAIVENGALKL
ncbi:aminopeptidase [Lysobacter solisilvae (ex Woo and Kim 2022)]|uniref:Aminopeptidase n=1 Tax=Agrilutibacter terrestris TaxID=2865112 RepID=A0A7H0G064_9GAMM|nr:aminopeptidase [Lysobacter terrestris]QNP41680.1 aminopeptidase [Lysobacter terrestris]